MFDLCRAPGVNYNRPHVPVMGKFDGKPRPSCRFCGRWLSDVLSEDEYRRLDGDSLRTAPSGSEVSVLQEKEGG